MLTQTVDLSNGAIEYTWPATFTELSGVNIDGDTVQVSIGTATAPGTWHTPDLRSQSAVTAQDFRRVHPTVPCSVLPSTVLYQVSGQLLLGVGGLVPTAGSYWVWLRVTDLPEIVPRAVFPLIVR